MTMTDVVLLPRNVVVDRRTSELLYPTFIREGMVWHGGLTKGEDGTYELTYETPGDVATTIGETMYYAETDFPEVYGHVLIEVLPALWAYHRLDDRPRVASSIEMNRTYAMMLRALDVDADSVVAIDRPIHAEHVLFPEAPVYRRQWIHPVAWEVFDRLGRLARLSSLNRPERIFVSREHNEAVRPLLNQAEVEQFFVDNGFELVVPERLPIEDQVAMFSGAKLIAGLGGSAMHNAVFASRSAKVLHLCSEGWFTNADTLLSQVEGRLGYVFGELANRAEVGHRTPSDWSIHVPAVADAVSEHFGIRVRRRASDGRFRWNGTEEADPSVGA